MYSVYVMINLKLSSSSSVGCVCSASSTAFSLNASLHVIYLFCTWLTDLIYSTASEAHAWTLFIGMADGLEMRRQFEGGNNKAQISEASSDYSRAATTRLLEGRI